MERRICICPLLELKRCLHKEVIIPEKMPLRICGHRIQMTPNTTELRHNMASIFIYLNVNTLLKYKT